MLLLYWNYIGHWKPFIGTYNVYDIKIISYNSFNKLHILNTIHAYSTNGIRH